MGVIVVFARFCSSFHGYFFKTAFLQLFLISCLSTAKKEAPLKVILDNFWDDLFSTTKILFRVQFKIGLMQFFDRSLQKLTLLFS
ncbi:hypothetical protein FHR92_001942 [Fontibacillus solani]|uniref:Uncharacterized protein n=1 Tax=Fontibacillus solani TaxID=1572857 RepID=A0A7W3XRH2_9BACL|nr:hypothetical protein [Fontibacillus solani]